MTQSDTIVLINSLWNLKVAVINRENIDPVLGGYFVCVYVCVGGEVGGLSPVVIFQDAARQQVCCEMLKPCKCNQLTTLHFLQIYK